MDGGAPVRAKLNLLDACQLRKKSGSGTRHRWGSDLSHPTHTGSRPHDVEFLVYSYANS